MGIDRQGLEQAILQQHESLPFSGVIAVHERGELVFGRGFGFANRADAIPNTLDTRFAIASGSKLFTSIAICELIDKGSLSFDSHLTDCLEINFPNHDPDITVGHLLTHTSGIMDYFDEDNDGDYEALWQDLPMYRVRSPKDFLPLFQHGGMLFKPGTRFKYSDGAFIILGLIIEQHGGMPFVDYVTKNIFVPSGMTDSGYFYADRLPAGTASHYVVNEETGVWRTNVFCVPIVGAPDGGAFVTAADLDAFWSALLDCRLLSEETTRRLLTPQAKARAEGEHVHSGYGIWITASDDYVSSYYITGWDPGVGFVSRVFPDRDLRLTVMGNCNKPTFPMYRAILSALENRD